MKMLAKILSVFNFIMFVFSLLGVVFIFNTSGDLFLLRLYTVKALLFAVAFILNYRTIRNNA